MSLYKLRLVYAPSWISSLPSRPSPHSEGHFNNRWPNLFPLFLIFGSFVDFLILFRGFLMRISLNLALIRSSKAVCHLEKWVAWVDIRRSNHVIHFTKDQEKTKIQLGKYIHVVPGNLTVCLPAILPELTLFKCKMDYCRFNFLR